MLLRHNAVCHNGISLMPNESPFCGWKVNSAELSLQFNKSIMAVAGFLPAIETIRGSVMLTEVSLKN